MDHSHFLPLHSVRWSHSPFSRAHEDLYHMRRELILFFIDLKNNQWTCSFPILTSHYFSPLKSHWIHYVQNKLLFIYKLIIFSKKFKCIYESSFNGNGEILSTLAAGNKLKGTVHFGRDSMQLKAHSELHSFKSKLFDVANTYVLHLFPAMLRKVFPNQMNKHVFRE